MREPGGAPMDEAGARGVDRSDALFALLVLAVAAAALALGFQPWLAGDGAHLLDSFLFEDGLWMHVLYLPAARALAAVLEPVRALQAVSVLGGALGTAATYLLARGLGVARTRALGTAALALGTPAIWFFATPIEVHALHFAAASAAAAAVVLAPVGSGATGSPGGHGRAGRAAWVSTAVACAAAPLVYLTHKSGLLLAPGLVALAALARAEARGTTLVRAFMPAGWVLALGAVGAAFVGSIALGAWLVPANSVGSTLEFLQRYQRVQPWIYLRDGVLAGLGVLVVLGPAGWMRATRDLRLASAAFVLPVALFFTWYGESNRGAYFTAIVPVLAVLAVRALPRGRAGTGLVALAVALQLALALWSVRAYAAGFSPARQERRVEAVRAAMGPRGRVITFSVERQPVTLRLPDVREINLRLELVRALTGGAAPEQAARDILAFVREVRGREATPLVLDVTPAGGGRRFTETLERLAAAAEAELGAPAAREPLLFVVR
jgi:hypothetical protein